MRRLNGRAGNHQVNLHTDDTYIGMEVKLAINIDTKSDGELRYEHEIRKHP